MKIDRLIGILSVLLQQERTTAPRLAERFEVSRRTINRDIEALCKAGIPICTVQGSGGGISIMEGYRMDRTLLTSKEMQMILAGLSYLIFKWSSWYVWGWCLMKEDFRLFKLNRMGEIHREQEGFQAREVPMPDLSNEKLFPGKTKKLKALFEPETKWRLVEEFGPHCFEETSEGKLFFQADYADANNMIGWLLTFGDRVKVQEPEAVWEKIRETAENMVKIYDMNEED